MAEGATRGDITSEIDPVSIAGVLGMGRGVANNEFDFLIMFLEWLSSITV